MTGDERHPAPGPVDTNPVLRLVAPGHQGVQPDNVIGDLVDPVALIDTIMGMEGDGHRLAWILTTSDPAATLMALGDAAEQRATADVTQGLSATGHVLTLADAAQYPVPRGRARRARAQALSHAGRFDEALSMCDAAAAILTAAGDDVEAARARLASVQALNRLGRYDEAMAAGETARRAFNDAARPELAARADINLGAIYRLRDDPATALIHYDRARPALVAEPLILARLETNRGVALLALDRFRDAEAAFARAAETFAAAGMPWSGAVAEGNLAYLAARQGHLARALHHFAHARSALEHDESPADLARLLAEEADALAILGLPEDARATFEQVIPVLDTHGLVAEAAQARAGLGRVLVQLGHLAEAEPVLTEAARAFEKLDQGTPRARVDLIRAELAIAAGQVDEARTLLNDALLELGDRPADLATGQARLAHLALSTGDLSVAAVALASAIPPAEQLDLAPVLADLYHAQGLLHRARGEPDDAARCLDVAVQQIERLRGALQAERFRTAFLGWRLHVYEDATLQALESGHAGIGTAFAHMERAKSRALLDLIGGTLESASFGNGAPTNTEADLTSDVADRLGQLQSELNWHISRIAESDDGAPSPALLFAIHDREREIDRLRERLVVTRGPVGLYAPPLTLDDALEFVPPGTAIVAYFIARGEVLATVLRDGEAHVCRRLTTVGDLAEQIRRFRFQLGRATGPQARADPVRGERLLADAKRALGQLSRTIWAPLASALGAAERLIVVPHGPLHTVPFHALWDEQRRAHLLEHAELRYAPSVSLAARMHDAARAREDDAAHDIQPVRLDSWRARRPLVVGVADDRAPQILAEAERIAATLDANLLVGDAATVAGVIEQAAAASTIHFACHGRFFAERPLASGLRMSDRWLTVRDISELRLSTDLVTLSGCETGRSAVTGGDELLGLIRGFAVAGAPSIVASLWNANDESTADLMDAFYAARRTGATTATAMRAGQLTVMARRPHPIAWAPFTVNGAA